MSFEGNLSPSIDLRCLRRDGALPDGWGLGWYPSGDASCTVLKEPAPPAGGTRSSMVKAWDHLNSPLVLLHMRAARWGAVSDANTQPFSRSWGRRDWLFVHAGSLAQTLTVAEPALFEPVGSTDTETIFCELLTRLSAKGWRSLGDADPLVVRQWFAELNQLGVLTSGISDGTTLVIHADRAPDQPLFVCEVAPPYDRVVFGDDDVQVDLTLHGAKARRAVLLSTSMLRSESAFQLRWRQLAPGTLLVLRQGMIVAELPPDVEGEAIVTPALDRPTGQMRVAPPTRPKKAEARHLDIRHRTTYRYDRPIERSTHLLRLEPVHDRVQRVTSYDLRISVDGRRSEYDDVFGNRACRLLIDTPFTELTIESHSTVLTTDTDPLQFRPLHARVTIPLNWMPWQRHMLQPYLLPPELPETQLIELHEYAMTFVERNGYDLVDTLLDMNQSIFRDYAYVQGATTLSTTPFDVYTARRGVCQDFTNLVICLARLLGIPARYVCGYLYTGEKHHNRAMAEATHAWAQVYLQDVGWKGLDPTNGVLTQTDHVRCAVGRNYVDATPTSGTIFVGGGTETLEVAVTVELAK
jgi:transglutaminase-like putative cysteine protease/predicted glutamine amidotransferase